MKSVFIYISILVLILSVSISPNLNYLLAEEVHEHCEQKPIQVKGFCERLCKYDFNYTIILEKEYFSHHIIPGYQIHPETPEIPPDFS